MKRITVFMISLLSLFIITPVFAVEGDRGQRVENRLDNCGGAGGTCHQKNGPK